MQNRKASALHLPGFEIDSETELFRFFTDERFGSVVKPWPPLGTPGWKE